ncbi:MAG TPA: hypothetical protein VIL86_16595 [Tepidisphaeraceae bacterium]|jgi:hypothetical protein
MDIRFHTDLDGEPHIHAHNVSEAEVLEVLNRPLERIAGRNDSFITTGRTRGGRILNVIHAPLRGKIGIFVITAYDLPAKQIRALNRRLKRRRRS